MVRALGKLEKIGISIAKLPVLTESGMFRVMSPRVPRSYHTLGPPVPSQKRIGPYPIMMVTDLSLSFIDTVVTKCFLLGFVVTL